MVIWEMGVKEKYERPRSLDIAGLDAVDAEARLLDHGIDRAVEMAASANPLPHRGQTVPPGEDTGIRLNGRVRQRRAC